MNRESMRWLLLFIALTGAFYWIDQTEWFNTLILSRVALVDAEATIRLLSFLGMPLERTGATIITPAGAIEIAKSCTGSFVFMMFSAAVLPFPTTWRLRLKGIFFGLIALSVLNLFRTCMIVLVGARFPGAMEAFHVIVGQIIVIAGMTAVFLWWAKASQQDAPFSFFKKNRDILRALSLFSIGYLCGFWLYRMFLESPFGLFMRGIVQSHTLFLISVLTSAFQSSHLSQIGTSSVRLIEGCLSSPMVVLFAAVVFAWPGRWWKRMLIIVLGFLPFFYGYHVLRAVLITLTLGIQAKEVNFVYNFYGQILLAFALFAATGYVWCTRRRRVSHKRFLFLFFVSALIGAIPAVGLGTLMRHVMVPILTDRLSGTARLSYDPEQSVSLMFDLQAVIWVSLVGSTPFLSRTRKCLIACAGVLIALILTVGTILLIEVFQLAPHKGLFKLCEVVLPFAVYYFLFLHPGYSPRDNPKSPRESYSLPQRTENGK